MKSLKDLNVWSQKALLCESFLQMSVRVWVFILLLETLYSIISGFENVNRGDRILQRGFCWMILNRTEPVL